MKLKYGEALAQQATFLESMAYVVSRAFGGGSDDHEPQSFAQAQAMFGSVLGGASILPGPPPGFNGAP